MFKHQIFQFVVILTTAIGVSRNVNGASIDNSQDGQATETASEVVQSQVTLQDLKEYIQPILYQKLLRTPNDSLVLQQAKNVVSEYLTDSLIETIVNPSPQRPQPQTQQKPTFKQNNANTITSAGATLVQAVAGATGNRTHTHARPTQQHVYNQVDSIIQNVNGANITGIVDQALLIRAPAPVRQLVNGILNSVLCNPFNRLWNNCAGGGSLLFGPRNVTRV